MSKIASFITKLLSSSSLQLRQSHEFPDYITVLSESAGSCHVFADRIAPSPIHFKDDTAINLACWTLSSMPNDEFGTHWENPNSSFIWAWVELPEGSYNQSWLAKGVGNLETGGIAGGHGCWIHEYDMKNGEDLYLPDEIRWCGDPPHHQVASPGDPGDSDDFFVCRNCTNLDDPICQTTYPTDLPDFTGYTDVGCWKRGTEVDGNTTWVTLMDPEVENCWISPDQFVPEHWHGLPAGECED